MMWVLLLYCGTPEVLAQDEQVEQTAKQAQMAGIVEIQDSMVELAALIAYARDQDLVEQGYAPEGWEQPTIDVYTETLGDRPSLLPYENFMRAVSDEKCSAEDGARYARWEAARIAEEAAVANPPAGE